ncbi:MAG: 6,7-dimethyl-8-ribityllumazine synthase [Proteobacteria bacterium]|nr:6,7-dimethyl-8-ribityllumazine synthase [Pseudomonadota bacterium]
MLISKAKILIVESIAHPTIANNAFLGAEEVLNLHFKEYERISVQEVFDIACAVGLGAEALEYCAIVVLGALVESLDNAADRLFAEVIRNISDISAHYSIPIGLGVLLVKNEDEGIKISKEYGRRAVISCMQLLKVKERIQSASCESFSHYKN